MNVVYIEHSRRYDWDAFLAQEPTFSLLQSWDWGQFKEKLGWKVYRIAVEDHGQIVTGAQMLIKPLVKNFISVAYVPRGPFGRVINEDTVDIILPELHRIAKTHRAVFLKIEPALPFDSKAAILLKEHNFLPSPLANQPTATITVDLKQDIEKINQQMRKRTREYIRYSEKNGVTLRVGSFEDLPEFNRIMRATAQREQFASHNQEYYKDEWVTFHNLKQAVMLLAYFKDQLLAVHMSFRFGKHAAYFHGGSLRSFTELRPNYLLLWEAIKWAKAQGCVTYDLWGIPNEVGLAINEGKEPPISNRSDGLWGVYHFKRGFSKNVLSFLGSWDYVYNPVLYPLFVNKYLNIEIAVGLLSRFDSFIGRSKDPAGDNANI